MIENSSQNVELSFSSSPLWIMDTTFHLIHFPYQDFIIPVEKNHQNPPTSISIPSQTTHGLPRD